MIYRASEHGFDGSNYYNKCYKANVTLKIIKTTNNNIFGGCIESALTSAINDPTYSCTCIVPGQIRSSLVWLI